MADAKLNLRVERPPDSVREQVVRAVRDAIADGALAPGRRLTERELIELTGVSRTSVREALLYLQAEGLVESSPSGLCVARLTADQVEQIYEIRERLEPLAVARFAEHATEDQLAELMRNFDGTLSTDPALHAQSIYAFHATLLSGCGNPILRDILTSLHTRIQPVRRLSTSLPGRIAAATIERKAIVTAITSRQPDQAEAASRQHIVAARQAALQAIRQTES